MPLCFSRRSVLSVSTVAGMLALGYAIGSRLPSSAATLLPSPATVRFGGAPDSVAAAAAAAPARAAPPPPPPTYTGPLLELPPAIRRLSINVGPNTTPLLPPAGDPAAGVLAVEAQLGVAAALRDSAGRRYPDRFFVIAAALAGEASTGFGSLRLYNAGGQSSSLATAAAGGNSWASPGASNNRIGGGVEYVPVLSLGRLLAAVPADVEIPELKTDTQGFDFAVVSSADRASLRRVRRLTVEVYNQAHQYNLPPGVSNDLAGDWVPHMRAMGYRLVRTTGQSSETDAIFERVGEP